ncbi:hypothetical protein QR680_007141 [Steinernema hermaphroditum]|uniref:RING-type domain-containing protein n=1 Tax=Steinernema hermaphroditum TaxID=289476 RepID=A0AA39LXQ1_9BILA|nr:hypothetical protein QR680_007141 [Steinernema hermaphroditum]
MSTSSTCPICLTDFVERGEIAKTPCGHFYHIECINRALVESRRCPYCRANVVGVEKIQANTRHVNTGAQPSSNSVSQETDNQEDVVAMHREVFEAIAGPDRHQHQSHRRYVTPNGIVTHVDHDSFRNHHLVDAGDNDEDLVTMNAALFESLIQPQPTGAQFGRPHPSSQLGNRPPRLAPLPGMTLHPNGVGGHAHSFLMAARHEVDRLVAEQTQQGAGLRHSLPWIAHYPNGVSGRLGNSVAMTNQLHNLHRLVALQEQQEIQLLLLLHRLSLR